MCNGHAALGVCGGGGSNGLGNASYLFLGVGIIQMLKAAAPLIVLVVFTAAGDAAPSPASAGAVGLITLGTLVTIDGAPGVTTVALLPKEKGSAVSA